MINNAGYAPEAKQPGKPVWEYDEDAFDLVVKINLKGSMLGTKYAAKQMIKQEPHKCGQRGWIVNIGSIYGLVGEQLLGTVSYLFKVSKLRLTYAIVGYVSSKHGVLGLTKSAALDCAPHRINVNAVCPGCKFTSPPTPVLKPNELTIDKPDLKTAMTEFSRTNEAVHAALSAKHALNGGGFGEPQDVANVILFLASEENTWMTGSAVPVDGGFTSN